MRVQTGQGGRKHNAEHQDDKQVVMVLHDVVKKANNRSTTAFERREMKISLFYIFTYDGHKMGPLLHQARRSFGTGWGKGGCHGYGKARPRSNKACIGQVICCKSVEVHVIGEIYPSDQGQETPNTFSSHGESRLHHTLCHLMIRDEGHTVLRWCGKFIILAFTGFHISLSLSR